MKKCPKCREYKENFSLNKAKRDGFSNWCKSCVSQYQKEIYKYKFVECSRCSRLHPKSQTNLCRDCTYKVRRYDVRFN